MIFNNLIIQFISVHIHYTHPHTHVQTYGISIDKYLSQLIIMTNEDEKMRQKMILAVWRVLHRSQVSIFLFPALQTLTF